MRARGGRKRPGRAAFRLGNATLIHDDCFRWLANSASTSIEAVVTDPPYGLIEYSEEEQIKMRNGHGGVWRIPPSFDGNKRAPLPRFTVLSRDDIAALERFFQLGTASSRCNRARGASGGYFEPTAFVCGRKRRDSGRFRAARRDYPFDNDNARWGSAKAAHKEFADVSVMPRSMWEPWLLFRKPIEGRVQDNLRRWKTGGFRRPTKEQPFGDVIQSAPTRKEERELAPHPNLKPQALLRRLSEWPRDKFNCRAT